MQVDLRDKQILVLPANKKVSCVEYEDGTAEIFVDLPNDLLAVLYKKAAEDNCEVEEVIKNALFDYLSDLEEEEITEVW